MTRSTVRRWRSALRSSVVIAACTAMLASGLSAAGMLATEAQAGAALNPNIGYDVSYPQCPVLVPPGGLPAPASFTVLGVNGGLSYSANPCLAQLYDWAQGTRLISTNASDDAAADIALYANTGNPGPQVSTHWPTGENFPRFCDGSWNVDCAYDYGWNAAGDAFALADAKLPPGTAASATWWLDVETANSWNHTDLTTNVAALQGFLDRLSIEAPYQPVGFYSNRHQWGLITGATSPTSSINAPFSDAPNWVAGATVATAPTFCGDTFTGGPVHMVQYVDAGIDHDRLC